MNKIRKWREQMLLDCAAEGRRIIIERRTEDPRRESNYTFTFFLFIYISLYITDLWKIMHLRHLRK